MRVVELRFFGGSSIEETLEMLGISAQTVRRDWKFAPGVAGTGDEAGSA